MAYNPKYNKIRRHQAHKWINEFKKSMGCKNCGNNNPIVLDLHHPDPGNKDFQVSTYILKSFDLIKSEARKCIVLCANCHRIDHWNIRVSKEVAKFKKDLEDQPFLFADLA